MDSEKVTHRQSLYFHPDTEEWTQEREGATHRHDCTCATTTFLQVSNALRTLDPQTGKVVGLADESTLSAVQRGYVFDVWPTMADGREFLAFRGVRMADENMRRDLLKGLVLHDGEGQVVGEPTTNLFHLTPSDGEEFIRRLGAMGARVSRSDPTPPEALAATEGAELVSGRMRGWVGEDRGLLLRAREGDFGGMGLFERNYGRLSDSLKEFVRLSERARTALAPLTSPGKSVAERAVADSLMHRLREARAVADAAMEEREMLVREFANLHAKASGNPAPESSPVQRKLMFKAVASELANHFGFTLREVDGGVQLRVGEGWLTLGEEARYDADA